MNTISILGCGWLGLPLAKRLILQGFHVKGSTTTKSKLKLLEDNGIEPYRIVLEPNIKAKKIDNFLDTDFLVINIPPMRGENIIEFYPAQIKSIIKTIEDSVIEKVVFVSSTSVYGNNNQIVTEESELNPERNSGKALVIAEGLIRANIFFQTTIIRFGGLVGQSRHPGKFLTGRKNLSGTDTKVNLIHLDDCIEIITQIIRKNLWGEIFNAAADEHPTKKELYTKAALVLNLEPPTFSDKKDNYKIVSSEKLKLMLNYKFKFPNPLEMF